MESLKEISDKANIDFPKNEEKQNELRKRFYSGFHCNLICTAECKYAEASKRFNQYTDEGYTKYVCSLRCKCSETEQN